MKPNTCKKTLSTIQKPDAIVGPPIKGPASWIAMEQCAPLRWSGAIETAQPIAVPRATLAGVSTTTSDGAPRRTTGVRFVDEDAGT